MEGKPLRLVEPPKRLGAGEIAAVSLAAELGCPVLVDDRDGVRLAEARGLDRIGTLGVLIQAHVEGLDHIREALDLLAQTSFHATPALFERAIAIAEQRRKNDHPET